VHLGQVGFLALLEQRRLWLPEENLRLRICLPVELILHSVHAEVDLRWRVLESRVERVGASQSTSRLAIGLKKFDGLHESVFFLHF